MRRRSFLLDLLYLAACAPAQAGEVFLETFRSAAIGRDYKYTIYLPDPTRRSSGDIRCCICGRGRVARNERLQKAGAR